VICRCPSRHLGWSIRRCLSGVNCGSLGRRLCRRHRRSNSRQLSGGGRCGRHSRSTRPHSGLSRGRRSWSCSGSVSGTRCGHLCGSWCGCVSRMFCRHSGWAISWGQGRYSGRAISWGQCWNMGRRVCGHLRRSICGRQGRRLGGRCWCGCHSWGTRQHSGVWCGCHTGVASWSFSWHLGRSRCWRHSWHMGWRFCWNFGWSIRGRQCRDCCWDIGGTRCGHLRRTTSWGAGRSN